MNLNESAFNDSSLLEHKATHNEDDDIEKLAHKTAKLIKPTIETSDEDEALRKLDKIFMNTGL